MELSNYFKILSRHKFTLIIIPLLAIVITYFLVRNQPDSYTSDTQIATGIVDQTQQNLNTANGPTENQITQDFDNLLEMIRSKKVVEQVSYQLMIHDLTSPRPFSKPSKLLLQLNTAARLHAVAVYTDFYNKRQELSLFNDDQRGLAELIGSMKYDNESLLKNFNIYRAQTSDFIDVEYTANNPEMTAFVVNSLAHEFITYYTTIVRENQVKAITFLGALVQSKRDTLDAIINQLKNYKIQNQILNIPEESRAVYTQIADFETHLEQAQRDAASSLATIKSIDDKFKPGDRQYMESLLVPVNQDIANLTDQLKAVNQKYVESNFDEAYGREKDSLNKVLEAKIGQSSDIPIVNPIATQQNLIQQRLTLQIQYEIAKSSIGSIQNELTRLNAKLNGIVPHEAVVQKDESAIDIAQKEYLDILNKYNQTSLDANYTVQLRQMDTAQPGAMQPTKKMLLVILSGIIMFIVCLLVFFYLWFIDDTVKTPAELANKTGVPVLGYLNLLTSSTIDLRKVWSDDHTNPETYQFRNLLQSIRFEVDTELAGNKVLVINSLSAGEGKTFVATNLAYAYSLVNKRVLLIDGNFSNPGISDSVRSRIYVEDYINGTVPNFSPHNTAKITVLSNKGGDGSLLEVNAESVIKEKFDRLRDAFDIIIIEASALSTLNKSKEWNKFSDKILAVFEAGKGIKEHQKKHIEYLKALDGKFMGWVLNVVYKMNNVTEVPAED